MKFIELAQFFESLRNTKGTNAKLSKLKAYVANKEKVMTCDDYRILVHFLSGHVFALGDKRKLGVAEETIKKAIARATNSTDSFVAERYNQLGHLGLVAQELKAALVIKAGDDTQGVDVVGVKLTMVDLIDELPDGKVANIATGLKFMTPLESLYYVSLLLEKFPPGVGVNYGLVENAIADAFKLSRPKVKRAHNICCDLGTVAEYALDGDAAMDELSIMKPFTPSLPMLADNVPVGDGVGARMCAQPKRDGIRCQMHKQDKVVKLYSRGLEDITAAFPEIVEDALAVFGDEDVITDGEIIAVQNYASCRALPYNYISKRTKRTKNVAEVMKEIPARYEMFDILWHNGEGLMDLTYQGRLETLTELAHPTSRVAIIDTLFHPASEDILLDYRALSIANGNEGLVFKNLDEEYFPDERLWGKNKVMLEPLTLAISGAYYGTGKNAGMFSSFELSCINVTDGVYVKLGAVANFDEKTMEYLTRLVQPHIVGSASGHISIMPVVLIEVTYEELQQTNGNISIRFPRYVKLRDDMKLPDTLQRVYDIAKKQTRHA